MSVSKLAQDNNVYIEFNGYYCFIKDKTIGQTLLNGTLNGRLYHLDTFIKERAVDLDYNSCTKKQPLHKNKGSYAFVLSGGTNLANSCAVVAKTIWHKRLEHPSSDSIIKSCNLPVNYSFDIEFCDSYQLGKADNLPFPNSQSHATAPFNLVYSL